MRAVIVGAGMGGLMAALALRQSGVFVSVDIYEQTKVPSTAGAGLNIPPNGARICRWLGVDLDGGDPRGRDGVIDLCIEMQSFGAVIPDGQEVRMRSLPNSRQALCLDLPVGWQGCFCCAVLPKGGAKPLCVIA